MKFWLPVLTSLFLFSGCTTGNLSGSYVTKKRVTGSLEGIIKAFDKATMGVRGKSHNGREIVSRYQSMDGDEYESGATKKVRGYARILILGERRPYDLQVQFVVEEVGDDGEYYVKEFADDRANKILKKVLELLVRRPEQKDFIDDFRTF